MQFERPMTPANNLAGAFSSRPRRPGLVALLLCSAVFLLAATPARAADTQDSQHTVEGKLVFIQGTGPVVKTATKQIPLAGRYDYISRTLEDGRLRNDEVRLKGEFQAGGNFRVDNIFTIHNGEAYRVRYFCETCNIVGLGPGKCVCCQQPTELQEVPVDKNDTKTLITH
ncbi:MAG: hypothetical protein EPN47_14400 [Acidobacteria bacterium]|nr:MAG: hypothetical protein EPN47_14400 [Acidobacteriota bacterium]